LLFFYQILFFVPQWHYHPSFIKIVDISDLYTRQNQNVHCAVSSNDRYQGNGFAAGLSLGPKSRPNRSHRKRRGVIAFPLLGTWWNATTQVASQSVHWQVSYGISNIFQQRPSAILNS